MHLHWERSTNTAGDCIIRSLSWMGRVPDEIPQEEGWKLSRNHYYQEGWLSTANLRGVVGVTYTSSLCGDGEAQLAPPSRTNYNLRGHRAEVTLVRWNEPYQKLASCDSSGIIFVWIKYEGRWSIELINDRNTPVICFSWSHDGRMALICYQDGFVLVGSVAGQRYWSTLLPADVNNITSGVWTPDDQFVYLGTSQGDIVAMDTEGNTVGRVTLKPGVAITDLAWNCEKFNMEEQTEQTSTPRPSTPRPPQQCLRSDGKPYVLAAAFRNGDILLLRSYDDVIPQVIHTGFQNFCMDWTNSGKTLAVAGKTKEFACKSDHSIRFSNKLHFYNENGKLMMKSSIPCETSPVTALVWGHNDKRLFIATGNAIHIAWISSQVASLQLMSRLKIHSMVRDKKHIEDLPLPCRMQNLIGMLFTQTIRCCIPNPSDLRDFVLKPQPDTVRLHCTMIRHTDNSTLDVSNPGSSSSQNASNTDNSSYTLYLEHLGGFLPLLKGKKISKIKPEFVIFDPLLSEDSSTSWLQFPTKNHLRKINLAPPSNSETETEEDLTSPRIRRRQRRRRGPLPRYGYLGGENIDYMNILPEETRLAEVSSNIWGTKFKIVGQNCDQVPSFLGQINYKASLLHLQPRQMRVEIVDLRDDLTSNLFDPGLGIGEDDDWLESDDFEPQEYGSTRAGFGSEDDEEDNGGVTMKDDILTAVTTEHNIAPIAPLPSRLSFCVAPRQADQLASTFESRPPTSNQESCKAPSGRTAFDNELYMSNAIVHEMTRIEACSNELDLDALSPTKVARVGFESPTYSSKKSPTFALPSMKSIKGEASVIEAAFTPVAESPTCHKIFKGGDFHLCESPSKQRRLRVSVSCDNHLSDAKILRRDSGGSGNSSPLRWAAKADELTANMMTTSLIAAPGLKDYSKNLLMNDLSSCQRSCSANELDAIVDIIGVPSEVLTNKRLILLGDKTNPRLRQSHRRNTTCCRRTKNHCDAKKIPTLEVCGKSKSCDVDTSPKKSKRELEAKRRSIYGRECKGRHEAKPCTKCINVASQVKDIELNREIFDIPTPPVLKPPEEELEGVEDIQVVPEAEPEMSNENSFHVTPEVPAIQVLHEKDDTEVVAFKKSEESVESFPDRSPRPKRRFDAVRNLLERARQKLLLTKQLWSHQGKSSEDSKKENLGDEEVACSDPLNVPTNCSAKVTQSSPSTPAEIRKNKGKRNRSFSPVRSFLNSPLIRRKKRNASQDDTPLKIEPEKEETGNRLHETETFEENLSDAEEIDDGYRNLESFQRRKLKQKLRKFSQPSNILPTSAQTGNAINSGEEDDRTTSQLSSSVPETQMRPPYPSPPPAPQRVPHRPANKLRSGSHQTSKVNGGVIGSLSPFLGRKLFGGAFPATPNSTPFSTPFVKRKNYSTDEEHSSRTNSFLSQHNQVYSLDKDPLTYLSPHPRRRRPQRKLLLHNKAPMWNEASQVYQLDFGGRVTQESAKNFQIEFKGKQVMQFGRIDNNAYTLDFQYPFTAIQAFAVALANVTQRLK